LALMLAVNASVYYLCQHHADFMVPELSPCKRY
jgi:hypothetical protein